MKPRPRGRYKKKKRDLLLYLKMTLICYLTIFGVAYMSSDTSAYLSSQSVITETITAGIWEVPEVLPNACGMDDSTDQLPGEESVSDAEDKAKQSQKEAVKDAIDGEEIEVDCGDQNDASGGKDETDVSNELDCKKTDVPVKEEKPDDTSNEKVTIDCKKEDEEKESAAEVEEVPAIDKEKEAEDEETPAVDKESEENESATENDETPAIDNEKEVEIETPAIDKESEEKNQNESITEEKATEKDSGTKTDSAESKENDGQKPNDESLKQSKSNDELVNKSDEGSQK